MEGVSSARNGKGLPEEPFFPDPFSPGVSAYSFPTRTNAMTSA
jgi:tellurite resistance protein TehA-like permease